MTAPREAPVLDVVGVGIGPFNLGFAALAASVPELTIRLFDARPSFDWHSEMLIEGATLQVTFLADLVTAADPTSRFSFLAYMKRIGRLYPFAIREAYCITRKEYNRYCRWVAAQLPSLEFDTRITRVSYDDDRACYRVEGRRNATGVPVEAFARNVVVGVGSVPHVPPCVPRPLPERLLHSATYLARRDALLSSRSVVVVGSGQSAAEIFLDLLERKPDPMELVWMTRAERFFPMDDSKLAFEMASPDFISHFHGLPGAERRRLLGGHDALYRGVSRELLGRIYDALYDRTIDGPRRDVRLAAGSALERVSAERTGMVLRFRHRARGTYFEYRADHAVLATGYEYRFPECLAPLRSGIAWDESGAPRVGRAYDVLGATKGLFVQNAAPESHGFTVSDLSLGPYRNSMILNAILGRPHFHVEERTAFQEFGPIGSAVTPAVAVSEWAEARS